MDGKERGCIDSERKNLHRDNGKKEKKESVERERERLPPYRLKRRKE